MTDSRSPARERGQARGAPGSGLGRRRSRPRLLAVVLLAAVLVASVGLTPARAALVSSLETVARAALGVMGAGSPSPEPAPDAEPSPDPQGTLPPIAPSGDEDVAGPNPALDQRATLEGRVLDAATGAPVPEALVRLDPYARTTSTKVDGRFVFEDLPLPVDHCPRVHVTVWPDGHEVSIVELYLRPGHNEVPGSQLSLQPQGQGRGSDEDRVRPEPPACAEGRR